MSTEGDPRISEADLATESESAHEADVESGLLAAEFDLDRFREQAILVHEFLNQSTWWVDVHQRRHAIRDMSVRYKANCLAFMRKRVSYFAARYPWGAIWALDLPSGWTSPLEGGRLERNPNTGKMEPVGGRRLSRGDMGLDDGGNMSHAFDQYIDDLQKRIDRSPADWLDDTPLMKALSDQVLAGEGGAVGDRPEDEPREMCPLDPCPEAGCELTAVHHKRRGPLVRLCTGEWVRLT